MKTYDRIKRQVKRLLVQEVAQRKLLLPAPEFYEHVRPEKPGEIWGEDFTDATVEGQTFKVAVVLDTYDDYYLGKAVDSRATAALVGRPIDQALQKTGGRGPEKFLLSDNGSQYISAAHGRLLTSAEIVQRRIPACVPQYNGCVEGGMRQLKSVFYNVWERRVREQADEEKNLLEGGSRQQWRRPWSLMNEAIPRPSLGGVTPADVHNGKKEVRRQEIGAYREREASRQDVPPWKRSYWDVLKSGLKAEQMSDGELLTKLDFFCRQAPTEDCTTKPGVCGIRSRFSPSDTLEGERATLPNEKDPVTMSAAKKGDRAIRGRVRSSILAHPGVNFSRELPSTLALARAVVGAGQERRTWRDFRMKGKAGASRGSSQNR